MPLTGRGSCEDCHSSPTDLSPLWPPTPALLPCIDRDGTVLLVQALLLVVITPTSHLLICMQRRENFQRTRTVLLLNPTKLLVRNRHIEKPSVELDPIWAGQTFRKWIVLQLVLMTTPSLVRSLLLQAKFLSRCPQKNGFVKSSVN